MTWILIIGIIVAFLLMLVVLVQNPKGGGLASNFSQGNQIFGVEKTTDIVEKITWGGALLLVLISLVAASYNGNSKSSKKQQSAKPSTESNEKLPDLKKPK
ncbi:MAG: preprotein translocase subunit SecG [Bacteroidetes bacterium]|nr:preprotein translocase subunit SecG [Bacteroidota bacterium]